METLTCETHFAGFSQHTIESFPYFGLEGDLSFSAYLESEDDQNRSIFYKTSRSTTNSVGFGVCGRAVIGFADEQSSIDHFNVNSKLTPNAWNNFRVFIGVSYLVVYLNDALVIVITSPKENPNLSNFAFGTRGPSYPSFVGKLKAAKLTSSIDLFKLQKEGICCDVELNGQIKVHSTLLSAFWPNWTKYSLKDIKPHILELFIELLYTGQLSDARFKSVIVQKAIDIATLCQLAAWTDRLYIIMTCNVLVSTCVTPSMLIELLQLSFELNLHTTTQQQFYEAAAKAMRTGAISDEELKSLYPNILLKLVTMMMKSEPIATVVVKDDTLDCIAKIQGSNLEDFTIHISEKLKANKSILAANSSYFKTLVQSEMKEARNNEVDLTSHDLGPAAFKSLLTFFYTRDITCFSYFHATQLSGQAQYFGLPDWLDKYWESLIEGSLNVKTALTILETSNSSDLLVRAAQVFISQDMTSDQIYTTLSSASPKACKYILLALLPSYKRDKKRLMDETKEFNEKLSSFDWFYFSQLTKFTAWKPTMIKIYNDSHNCITDDQKMALVDGRPDSTNLAWDSKDSGWIQFSFEQPMAFVATKLEGGEDSQWHVQRSLDEEQWENVSIIDGGKGTAWKSVRGCKYWRYMMIKNPSAPWYLQYEWYY